MVGPSALAVVTVKSLVELAVRPATSTWSFPVVAPAGTVTVSWLVEAELMAASMPLNNTRSAEAVAEKPQPWRVTTAPTTPEVGEKSRIEGPTWPGPTPHAARNAVKPRLKSRAKAGNFTGGLLQGGHARTGRA